MGTNLERRQESMSKELSIAVTDCKSCYDALVGVSLTGVADRTTALDALVVQQTVLHFMASFCCCCAGSAFQHAKYTREQHTTLLHLCFASSGVSD